MERVHVRPGVRRTGHTQKSPKVVVAVAAVCAAALVTIGFWTGSTLSASSVREKPVEVFTFVRSGIVYVDPDTAEIIWQSLHRVKKTIGEDPWTNPGRKTPNRASGLVPWREDRDIVGNPDDNVVSWVESVDGRRGDIVVVDALTGEVRARAEILAPSNHPVVIASVDDETVYFATPHPATGFPDVARADIWTWRWASGEDPLPRRSTRYVNDVSAGIWAVYGNGLEFEDSDGRTLSTHSIGEEVPTDFGSALSPDGRFWYGSRTSQIVETATGNVIEVSGTRERNYGWTARAELLMTKPFVVCSAATGRCHGPAGVPAQGVCSLYGIMCGNNLPVN